jgi:hypothetical protein
MQLLPHKENYREIPCRKLWIAALSKVRTSNKDTKHYRLLYSTRSGAHPHFRDKIFKSAEQDDSSFKVRSSNGDLTSRVLIQ